MKKAVAIVIIIVVVLMGGMFVWGFIGSQSTQESQPESAGTTSTQTDIQQDNSVENKSITLSELRKRNTAQECWLAINGSVYNVTDYISRHPGGADLILANCGKDASQAFNTQGGQGKHSTGAKAKLETYKIGIFE